MKFTKIFLFTLLAIFSLSFIANTTNVAQATSPVEGKVTVTVTDPTPAATYVISTSIGANGNVSPTTKTVNYGDSPSFTITPNTGYTASASGCGGSLSGTNYTTGVITADCIITASFTQIPTLSTPTNPSATISSTCGTTSGTISWTASTGATTYVIYRSTDNSSYTALTPNVSASPKTDSGLTAGQKYYYKIAAANGSGESAATAAVSYTVPTACAGVPSLSTTAISSITGTTASSGGNTITDGGSSITAKGVVWGTSSGPTTALATKTSNGTGTANFSSSITGLTAGTKYYVRAYATNSAGTGYGNEVSFTASAAIPPTPTSPSATISSTSCGTTSGTISWTASTGATTYVIYRSTNNSSYTALTPNVSAPTVSKTDSGLTAGQKYYYKIAAANGAGESAGTSAVSFTVPTACADATPTCYDGTENQDETGVDIGGVCGTCSDGTENGNETSADIGGRCAKGTLTISPTSCTIAENASTCPVNATWTTTKVATPVSLIDANANKTLSNLANRSTAFEVQVAFPGTTFKLKDNDNNTLSTKGVGAMCASGTNWDFINKICKNNSPTPPNLTTSASSPTTATVDVARNYTATITNSGSAAMGKASNYFFQVASSANGGAPITNKTSSTLSNLPPGGTATATLSNYTFTSVGTYSMRACADKTSPSDAGVITESNEGDNCGSWTNITVDVATCSDGIKNQNETSVDTGGVCDVGPGIDPIVADCKVVSDTTNIVSSGSNAVATWAEHPMWTASIPGATWIWRTFKVQYPESDETVTFTKTFYLTSTSSITNAQLITAADNTYTASINGTQIINQPGERNTLKANMQERYIKSYLNLGVNTLSFVVKNLAQTGGTISAENNPAGLLYRLSITDSSGVNNNCNTLTPPTLPLPSITSFNIMSNGKSALSPNTIRYNTRVNIDWTSENATSCACTSADTKGVPGLTCGDTFNNSFSFQTLSLKKSMIFTLSCLNGDGVSKSESKTVTVDDINTIYKEN